MSISMTSDYIRRIPVQARVKTLSTRIEAKKQKLDRYGGCLPSLEREIKNAESLLDDYLVEAAYDAMESLNNLQAALAELDYRKEAGYLTSDQIAYADGVKSHLGVLLANR